MCIIGKLRGLHEYSVSMMIIKLQMTYFVRKPVDPLIHIEMLNFYHLLKFVIGPEQTLYKIFLKEEEEKLSSFFFNS